MVYTSDRIANSPIRTDRFFHISGMSFGAISKPAVLALSRGAQAAGCWMNTGEGGLSPYHLEGGADIVYQIGTAKYGVRNEDGTLSEEKLAEVAAHEQVRMFEIKLSQGAKPGKGGILPGVKVTRRDRQDPRYPGGRGFHQPEPASGYSDAASLLDMINRSAASHR